MRLGILCAAAAVLLGFTASACALTEKQRKDIQAVINKKEKWIAEEAVKLRAQWVDTKKSTSLRTFCGAGIDFTIERRRGEVSHLKLMLAGASTDLPPQLQGEVRVLVTGKEHNADDDFTTSVWNVVEENCSSTEITSLAPQGSKN